MWEAELIQLIWQFIQGEKPSTVYFQGQSVDEINASWQELSKTRSLDKVLEDFNAVRKQTEKRVRTIPEKELSDPDRCSWLDGRAMWKWIATDSFEHEEEHLIQILEWRKRKEII